MEDLCGADPADDRRQRHHRSGADQRDFRRAHLETAFKRQLSLQQRPTVAEHGKDHQHDGQVRYKQLGMQRYRRQHDIKHDRRDHQCNDCIDDDLFDELEEQLLIADI